MDLTITAADDFHVHLRNDARTQTAILATRHGGSARVLAMPNTRPPVTDGRQAAAYRESLQEQGADFTVLTTVKLTQTTRPEDIEDAARAGVTAVKQYPLGVTTHSEDGIRDPRALFPIYELIRDRNMVLSLHGEVPDVFVMDAEEAFLESLVEIHRNFPDLKIVLEHITTAAAVEAVRAMPQQVAATITDHHLCLTLDDVVGRGKIQPHHFCMPIAKRPGDLRALVDVVREGHPSFFSGTDSAPHLVADKESACGCAGIFNAPYHMQVLATLFDRWGCLTRLEAFTSRFGADFYGLHRNRQKIALLRKNHEVPSRFGPLVPFWAGKPLAFDLEWIG